MNKTDEELDRDLDLALATKQDLISQLNMAKIELGVYKLYVKQLTDINATTLKFANALYETVQSLTYCFFGFLIIAGVYLWKL